MLDCWGSGAVDEQRSEQSTGKTILLSIVNSKREWNVENVKWRDTEKPFFGMAKFFPRFSVFGLQFVFKGG